MILVLDKQELCFGGEDDNKNPFLFFIAGA